MKNEKYNEELQRYMNGIKYCKRITKAREKVLADIITNSSDEKEKERAIKELVEANLTLVIDIVIRRTQNFFGTLSLMDFIAIGNAALLEAANIYKGNHKSRASFVSLAYSYINNTISDAMKKDRFISIPENYFVVIRAIKKFEKENGREPTSKELSKIIKVKISRIEEIRRILSGIFVGYLEDISIQGDDELWGKVPAAKDHHINRSLINMELQDFIKNLSPKYQEIIQDMYFGEQMSLGEFAKRQNVTKQLISFNSIKALRDLRCQIIKNYDKQHKLHTDILTSKKIDALEKIEGHKKCKERLIKEEKRNRPIYKRILSEYIKEIS
jgi:RNA polymerase sigma factor (sigma-70 family)